MTLPLLLAAALAASSPDAPSLVRTAVERPAGAEAAALWDRCDGRDLVACADLAKLYFYGATAKGIPEHRGVAERLARRACDAGGAAGCGVLAAVLWYGPVPEDEPRAIDLYRRACDGGYPRACGALGDAFANGYVLEHDARQAARLWQQACDGGDAYSCLSLARAQGGEADRALLERACELGSSPACLDLRDAVADRKDSASVEARARYLRRACGGDLAKCGVLVNALLYGREGIPRSKPTAECLARAACDAGDQGSCVELGWALVERDPPDASGCAVFQRACAGGTTAGCYGLAKCADRQLLAAEPPQVRSWLETACRGGKGPACNNLGVIERDDAAAVAAFQRACQLGIGLGCSNLGRRLASSPKLASALQGEPRDESGARRRACAEQAGDWCARASEDVEKRDLQLAFELRVAACVSGDADSCLTAERLGDARGSLVVEGLPRGRLGLVGAACELGRGDACHRAFELVGSDRRRARRWIELGCAAGDRESCTILTETLEAAGDQVRAAAARQRACEAGAADACRAIASAACLSSQGERADGTGCEVRPMACPDGMAAVPGGRVAAGEKGVEVAPFCIGRADVGAGDVERCVAAGKCKLPVRAASATSGPGSATPGAGVVDRDAAAAVCAWRGATLASDAQRGRAANAGQRDLGPAAPIAGFRCAAAP